MPTGKGGKGSSGRTTAKKSTATRRGAEGPKRSIAGGFGSVTRSTPGGGRKLVGPNKSRAALQAIGNETGRISKKKKK